VIDGTETEEETQARYRFEKQTWGNSIGGEVWHQKILFLSLMRFFVLLQSMIQNIS